MSDDAGQDTDTHTFATSLDSACDHPVHALCKAACRAIYAAANDGAVLAALRELTRVEGIMPALQSAHALAHAKVLAPTMRSDQNIVVNLSGRCDKDILTVTKNAGNEI